MEEAPMQAKINPGVDNRSFVQPTHVQIAQELTQLTGETYNPASLASVEDQRIVTGEGEHLIQEPGVKLDVQTVVEALKGADNEAPSGHFLKTFLGRLRRQHPGGVIQKV